MKFWKKIQPQIEKPRIELPKWEREKLSNEITNDNYKNIIVWNEEFGIGKVIKNSNGFNVQFDSGTFFDENSYDGLPHSIFSLLWDYAGLSFYYQEPIKHIKLISPTRIPSIK